MTTKQPTKAPKKFIVNRAHWVRGGHSDKLGDTGLLNVKDNMCCLGHCLKQCGVPRDRLLEESMPEGAVRKLLPARFMPEETPSMEKRVRAKASKVAAFVKVTLSKSRSPSLHYRLFDEAHYDTIMDLRVNNSALSRHASVINDSNTLTDKEREAHLKTLFKRHGLSISFVGKYVGGEITTLG